jgi:hypothetical protein
MVGRRHVRRVVEFTALRSGVVALSFFSGSAIAHAHAAASVQGGIAEFSAPAEAAPPAAQPSVPVAPSVPDAPVAVPEPPPTEPAPGADLGADPAAETPPLDDAEPDPSTEMLEATPADSTGAEPESEVDPNLLAAEPSEPTPARRPPQLETDPDAEAAALKATYNEKFRPTGNPTKVNFVVRALFANMGGRDSVGGRMGGARVDIGPAWNQFVVAGTVSAWGGKVILPRSTGAELNGLIGLGPTVGLGRLALLGRGFLDLRGGYDFMYGVVGQRAEGAVLQGQTGNGVVLTQTENLLPHGPRLTLDLGLVTDTRGRKYFQGFGASMGWQALVGSLRGDLPVTNMLTMGLSYWFG